MRSKKKKKEEKKYVWATWTARTPHFPFPLPAENMLWPMGKSFRRRPTKVYTNIMYICDIIL